MEEKNNDVNRTIIKGRKFCDERHGRIVDFHIINRPFKKAFPINNNISGKEK